MSAAAPRFELLQWHDAAGQKPDTNRTVALWTPQAEFVSGYWQRSTAQWIDCASGGDVGGVMRWADVAGPDGQVAITPADIHVDQVRAALHEALELVRDWVAHKCPKRHQAEHLAVVDALAKAGGL